MKAFTLNTDSITTNKRLITLFELLLLSSVGMFGQEAIHVNNVPASKSAQIASEGNNTDAQMELVSWFMGSKQSQVSNAINISTTTSTNNSGKKQYINCGMTPNRLLSRAFMKKAINHDSTIA